VPLKILLADDSMTAQKMGKEILTTAGYEVIAVSNGAVAAKKLAEKPDIIILDVFMPGYTGLELCEKIRASMDLAKTPVLLTVGKMEPFRPEEGQKVKADGVIVKPFEASDLLAAVQKLAEKIREDAKPKKSGAYEKTMIFKAPQVIDEVKEDSGDWRTQAEHAGEASGPPRLQMSSEMASAPAFGADLMGEASASPTPTFEMPPRAAEAAPSYSSPAAFDMTPPPEPVVSAAAPAAAFDENVAFAQHASGQAKTRKRNTAEIQAGAAIAAAAANAPEPVVESPSVESLLERTSEPSTLSSASSATAELERSGVVETSGAEIEVTPDPGLDRGYGDSAPAPGQDPALETDQTKMVSEFATKFGTSEPEAPTAENVDAEFEARVAAAMSGYEMQPDPALVADGSEAEKAAAPQVEAAITAPEVSASTPDYAATPDYEDTQKMAAPVVAEEVKAPEAQNPELAKLMQEAVAAVASPTEASAAEEPVVTAEVVAEEPAAKSSSDATAGAELANALAAAVGADVAPKANEIGDETTHRVVTRVLERMLPSIMTELAKEMEAAKNKK
jgi:CheY-like chemotaxis protein